MMFRASGAARGNPGKPALYLSLCEPLERKFQSVPRPISDPTLAHILAFDNQPEKLYYTLKTPG